jgi:diaminopimelate epimerase
MRFSKMEGLGNDFVVTHEVDASGIDSIALHIARLCDRRRGIGADGVIFILPSQSADYCMRIFNADGSEAEMCGNGIRCMIAYLEKKNLATGPRLTIETKAGMITTERLDSRVRVGMGAPILDAAKIPTAKTSGHVIMESLTAGGKTFLVTAVSMGNPHAVIFAERITDELVLQYGRELERHVFFPRRANVEFVRISAKDEIEMRVYERGCGETMACGTGACAAVVAGILTKKLANRVTVHLRGGDLLIEWDGDTAHPVSLTGPAAWVFDGEVAV